MKAKALFFCGLVIFMVSAHTAWAQTITGVITGTVVDSSGAAVPNVKIVATNVGTNLTYPTESNDAGIYNFPFLPIGNYTVSAEASGFKKVELGPFKLEVGQTARVDVKMQVGNVAETVQVTAIAPVLQTETTQTGDVITSTTATELPLNGRNFLSLTLLIPGAITPNPGSFNNPSRQFSGGRPYVNGNREQTNNFLLDGIDIDDPIDNVVGYNPSVDAIGEMQVITGNAPAEFGNASGAVSVMTIKSGTNDFHGNLFEFLRNDKLDANEFFQNRSGAAKRALRQNIFGATFGGPIKRNRAFFFVDYEGTRRVTSGAGLATVAPQSYRNGNMAGYGKQLVDPVTKQPFPGNMVPVVNPVAKALFANLALYPLPNTIGTGAILVQNNYLGKRSDVVNNDQADAKLDFRLSEKDNLSGRLTIARYIKEDSSVVLPVQLGGATDAPTTGGMIGWTRTFLPTLVNEARIGYTRVVLIFSTIDPTGLLGASGNQKLGIPGGQPIPGASLVSIVNDPFSDIGAAAADSATYDNTYQFSDNLTYQRGRHMMKMGFQILRYQQNRFYAGNNGLLGRFDYTGDYTGSSWADFLVNALRDKGRGSQTGTWGHRQSRIAAFFQDDFKLRPNLTLNLGLRWEYTQPLYEVLDRQSNFDLKTGKQLFAGKDGNSRALYNAYYKQFMPRVGIAWTPGIFNNRFVVRAGYGITSFMEGTGANLRLPLNPPFFFESFVQYDTNTPGDIRAGFTDVKPLSQVSGQVRAWNPDLRPAFIQEWNLSTEYQLTNSFSVNAGYVGQKGTHLVNPREYNQPLPGTGPVSTWAPLQQRRPLYTVLPLVTTISGTDSSTVMNYHALQLSGRKRFSHGLEFLASYTLSKTLTDNLGYFGSGGVNTTGAYWQNAYNRHADYGRSFFDARHNFSLGGFAEVPFGRSRHFGNDWNRAMDLVLGGWTLNYIVSMHTGFPVDIRATDRSGGQIARGNVRPNQYGRLTYHDSTIDHWFGNDNAPFCGIGVNDGKCAYGEPALGTFGNSGVNVEQAPHYRNLDLGMGKKFALTESRYLDFRAELFNVFNHPNFGPPGRSITAPSTFGAITTTVGTPRNVQLALKLYF